MTKEELNFIKDAFSQIIDDIAGNPDWGDAARSVASNLGTLERELEEKVVELPSDLDEAAEEYSLDVKAKPYENLVKEAFKDGSKWRDSQIPKLPSNLDEAAEEYEHNLGYYECVNQWPSVAFKAGAEWMAGQGMNIPAHIFMPSGIKSIYDHSKGEYPAAVHFDSGGSIVLERRLKDFSHNDEVIVQIRKK